MAPMTLPDVQQLPRPTDLAKAGRAHVEKGKDSGSFSQELKQQTLTRQDLTEAQSPSVQTDMPPPTDTEGAAEILTVRVNPAMTESAMFNFSTLPQDTPCQNLSTIAEPILMPAAGQEMTAGVKLPPQSEANVLDGSQQSALQMTDHPLNTTDLTVRCPVPDKTQTPPQPISTPQRTGPAEAWAKISPQAADSVFKANPLDAAKQGSTAEPVLNASVDNAPAPVPAAPVVPAAMVQTNMPRPKPGNPVVIHPIQLDIAEQDQSKAAISSEPRQTKPDEDLPVKKAGAAALKTKTQVTDPQIPLSPAQIVLNLVVMPVVTPPSSAAGASVCTSAPFRSGTASTVLSQKDIRDRLSLPSADSDAPLPDLTTATAQTTASLDRTGHSAEQDMTDQNEASPSLPSLASPEHPNRPVTSSKPAFEKQNAAAPMAVMVTENTRHLPVSIPSGAVFQEALHSGRSEVQTNTTIPTGSAAPVETDMRQTALRTLNLALSGEESAPVSVRMRLQGDHLNVAISSHHSEAVAAMLRDHSDLSQSLIGEGYKLESLTVQLASASSHSGDTTGSGSAPGQGQMSRQQEGRPDQTGRDQNGSSNRSNPQTGAAPQRRLPESNMARSRPRDPLYI